MGFFLGNEGSEAIGDQLESRGELRAPQVEPPVDDSKKVKMKGSQLKEKGTGVKGMERVEGGAVGGGGKGNEGQIYFLRAEVLDDGPFSGHCGLRQFGIPQEKRSKGQQAHRPPGAHTPFSTKVCACGRGGH